MIRIILETLKVCNNFRLEIYQKRVDHVGYCATPRLNSNAFICLANFCAGTVGPCADTTG